VPSIKQRLLQRTQSLSVAMNNQYSIHYLKNIAETTCCHLKRRWKRLHHPDTQTSGTHFGASTAVIDAEERCTDFDEITREASRNLTRNLPFTE